jgi:hypothetical protein
MAQIVGTTGTAPAAATGYWLVDIGSGQIKIASGTTSQASVPGKSVFLGTTAAQVEANFVNAFRKLTNFPSDLPLPKPTISQIQTLMQQALKGPVGTGISTPVGNLGADATKVAGAVGSAGSTIGDLVGMLTSIDFWQRLGESILGILLLVLGLRALTGGSGDPVQLVSKVVHR